MKNIKVRDTVIGSGFKPFIIAEMSGNHNQSLNRALEIVEAAAKSGAAGSWRASWSRPLAYMRAALPGSSRYGWSAPPLTWFDASGPILVGRRKQARSWPTSVAPCMGWRSMRGGASTTAASTSSTPASCSFARLW